MAEYLNSALFVQHESWISDCILLTCSTWLSFRVTGILLYRGDQEKYSSITSWNKDLMLDEGSEKLPLLQLQHHLTRVLENNRFKERALY